MTFKKSLKFNWVRNRIKGGEKMFKARGQSTLEYVLVLTAIVAAIIFAATKFVKPRVENSMDHVSQEMEDQVGRIKFGQ